MQAHKHANTFSGMENLSQRIKAARKYAGLTQKQLADAAKVEQPLISQLETGKTLKTAFITQIAKACRVSAMWLVSGEGEMTPSAFRADGSVSLDKPWEDLGRHQNVVEVLQPHRVTKEYPLISWVAAGCWQESCDNFQPGNADEWLQSTENAGPHGYWLEVKGPSMLPTFAPGMRILVKPENFDITSGKFYIAKLLDTGETTFKQYLRDGGKGYLQPLNSAFPVIPISEGVQIIGMVIDGKLPPIF